MDRKDHWEQAYAVRCSEDLSWYQETPALSLAMIRRAGIGLDEPIIDVGGGTSVLVDHLLNEGFRDLTVLDISATALDQSRQRLKARDAVLEWIEQDVTDFAAQRNYGLWHDRAVFHFLTQAKDRKLYLQSLRKAVRVGGQVIISTFAMSGPEKCSGLEIVRYDATRLGRELGSDFRLLDQEQEDHHTPAGRCQPFGYYRFVREQTRS